MVARVIQVVGAAGIAFGVGLFSLPAGIIVGSVFAVLIGVSMERGRAS